MPEVLRQLALTQLVVGIALPVIALTLGKLTGLSQAVCKSKEEYDALKVDLSRYMEDACKSGGYDLMAIMLTNPNGSGSYVLSAGSRKNVVKDAFAIKKDGFVEGLVSRKKQLLPGLIAALGVK